MMLAAYLLGGVGVAVSAWQNGVNGYAPQEWRIGGRTLLCLLCLRLRLGLRRRFVISE